jgi:hypothetical protein
MRRPRFRSRAAYRAAVEIAVDDLRRDRRTNRGIPKRPADSSIAGQRRPDLGADACRRQRRLGDARKAAAETIECNADRHAANVLPIVVEMQRAGAKASSARFESVGFPKGYG